MKISIGRTWIKILKITGISLGSILALMFLLPILFPTFISTKIKQWANSSITSEINFTKARLSFFQHFPSLTLTLYDLTLKGSKPFDKDTLVSANKLSLGIDLSTVFSSSIHIDKIFLNNADVKILVNKEGQGNYNIYEAKKDSTIANKNDSSGAALKIEEIYIKNSNLLYDDKSVPMVIRASNLNYEGHGDLSKAIFDLYSRIDVKAFDLYYDNTGYILSKKLAADLITKINTNSLALIFQKNDLFINKLPVQFNGKFEFLSSGYNMDFDLRTIDTDLHDMCTGLPPLIVQWLDSTDIRGQGAISATLKGKYIVEKDSMPDLALNVRIRDGFISNKAAPSPLKNLYLNFQSSMSQLKPDSFKVNIDSIYFNIEKDYFSGIVHTTGIEAPYIFARINANIDLGKLDRAIGIAPLDLKGIYDVHLLADGRYMQGYEQAGLRKIDTVIKSIPKFTLRSSLTNGYFKYDSLPEGISDISFNLDASCADNNYRHTQVSIDKINAKALGNYIKGSIKIKNLIDYSMQADLQTVLNLAEIKKFYPIDSMDLAGNLNVDIKANGKYIPEKKIFPVANAILKLEEGYIKTKYYPDPIEKIQVSADVTNQNGSFNTLDIKLTPVSFVFEGQPFMVKADLQNFSNLIYNIDSKGTLDVEKIYKVFAVAGYNVKGNIQTNLSLKGKQSDIIAGLYNHLANSGTLRVKNIVVTSDIFPLPFEIQSGLFRFDQDKIWFDQFKATYGKSDFTLDGYLYNVIDYVMNHSAPLKGNLGLTSNFIDVNEFMAFAGNNDPPAAPGISTTKPDTANGVVIVPDDLGIIFKASAKKIKYDDIFLNDFKGEVVLDSSKFKMNQTGFTIIGAPVVMDAVYKSLSPSKAQFDYHIVAKEFDVKRAYKEIKMFRDMASSAAKAEGIISLDYSLKGKLDANMHPVYPSLTGGGVLSVKKVKFNGLKLFSVVSKETEKDVNDPDLSKVDIKSTVSKNLIHIERTRTKISAFRFRFEGDVSFDGKLLMKMRLGLPPFGIFGIPIKVTGTQENPKVAVGKATDKDALEEKDAEAN
ncbi:MAG: hypothetical protein C5B52_14140 [Bacteroidetes bacterium]|nr:MAG: hypothetical protein C5B52_14140 [Bacteroidota bacterium]